MNRYQKTFSELKAKGEMGFMPFWMLGDPDLKSSQKIVEMLAQHADLLELGIPFSDPLADGKTIQASADRAIKRGATVGKCLDIVGNLRVKFPEKPIGLLVYLNLILQFGIDDFFVECKKQGVDSVLIPELPEGEVSLVENSAKGHEIDLIFLVSTNTPKERVTSILEKAGGFLYAISTPGITGAKEKIATKTLEMIKDLKTQTEIPVCVGFGISSPKHLALLKENGADGGIIGSKLFEFRNDINAMEKFCKACKKAIR
ncbi:tryptophan synthase subunit alpha [Candidatus Gracilibacteria bacterium]|nr:tryptophan synthase subunit alpha [Candidatus Gracilibacteria bacterium]